MRDWKGDVYWFIAYGGATDGALKLMEEHPLIISTRKHITELFDRILKRC